MKQPRINIRWYVAGDLLCAIGTWVLFYFLRTVIYHYPFSVPPGFYLGLFLYCLGWLSLHLLSGAYESLYQKTKIIEIFRTFLVGLIGCFGLLFFFILKNPQEDNANYYKEYFALLIPIVVITCAVRLLILKVALRQLQTKQVFFNTLMVGSGKLAENFFQAFCLSNNEKGFRITSFLNINGAYNPTFPADVSCYRDLSNITNILKEKEIEEVVITVDKQERVLLATILQQLSNKDVNIKITPDAVDIITGAVQTSNVMGLPLIDVHSGLLPNWQRNIKRFIDISVSILAMILLSPLMLYVAIRTKFSSPGSIIYTQERIGFKGIPFKIYKFRSMVFDAEKDGPMLSSEEDARITKWGKIMRTWRLDELPQLWNILIGEMSLVGPRPERQFYIDQIVEKHPEFRHLYKVKPGLTSWGMVKFGYAASVEEMIERMPYDLMYVENVNILLDIRILLLTFATLAKGKGK